MKDYIIDDDKVRLRDSNVAKMNIFEGMYYHRNIMIDDIIELTKEIKEILSAVLLFIVLSITYPYMAYMRIKQAKKEVKRCCDKNDSC